VSIRSSIANSGNVTVVYALAANPTTMARSGSLLIADQTFTISQAGGASTNAPISLEEALDTEGALSWSTIGAPEWFGETSVSLDGVDAAQSGAIGNGAAVTALSIITGPGTLSFWWKVSSETNKDYLKFFVDGVQQTRISGEVDWQFLSYSFSSGTYTSKWTYSKNDQFAGGQDRGWLDQVRFLSDPGCAVTLSHTNATHSSGAETGQVNVATTTGCSWNIITLSPWITPIVETAESNGLVRYTLGVNTSFEDRTGVIIIGGQPFTILQLAAFVPCTYLISPTTRTHGFGSATGSVSVTTHAGCPWNVINTNAWITIGSSLSNSSSGQVAYSVSQNDSSVARSGYVLIGDRLFFISQSGFVPCTYSLLPPSRGHNFGAATGTVSILTQSGCAWNVINTNGWITIISNWSGSATGQVIYAVASNATPVARSGNIRIEGQSFVVSQAAAPVTLAEALDTAGTSIVWNSSGSLPWLGTTSVSHDGVDAAQSGGSSSSSFRTTLTGPGTLTFWWKLSSELNSSADTLRLFVSGYEEARVFGQVDWQQRTVAILPGVWTVEWYHAKNSAVSSGWVDEVQFVPGSNCPVALSATGASHGSGSSTGLVSITASACAWSVRNTNSWISIVSPANGTANGTVVYVVEANSSAYGRAGNIRISGENFLITQLGTAAGCTVSILPGTRTHGYGAATNTVTVMAEASCAWSVSNSNSWITVLSGITGNGAGTVVYWVSANPSSNSRSGNLDIAGQRFAITQSGNPVTCAFALSSTSAMHGASSTTGLVSVTASAGCNWISTESNTWVTITAGLTGTGNGLVRYVLTINTSNLPRTAVISIAGQPFAIHQAGTGPMLHLHPMVPGASPTLSVEGNEGRLYVVECSDDFIHWIPIGTNSTLGIIIDAANNNAARRFYRSYELP
jgi:hypothetical protein